MTDTIVTRDAAVLAADATVIPIFEERLELTARESITGRVRIEVRTDVVSEPVTQNLAQTEVSVERRDIGRTLGQGEAALPMRVENGTTIIPVYEEILVVEKRLVLQAELHVTTRTATEPFSTEVDVLRQTVEVSQTGPGDAA